MIATAEGIKHQWPKLEEICRTVGGTALAEKLGITRATLQAYRVGRAFMPTFMAAAICNMFGVRLEDLPINPRDTAIATARQMIGTGVAADMPTESSSKPAIPPAIVCDLISPTTRYLEAIQGVIFSSVKKYGGYAVGCTLTAWAATLEFARDAKAQDETHGESDVAAPFQKLSPMMVYSIPAIIQVANLCANLDRLSKEER